MCLADFVSLTDIIYSNNKQTQSDDEMSMKILQMMTILKTINNILTLTNYKYYFQLNSKTREY